MPDSVLILRRANVSRKGGEWSDDDYDALDGDHDVGPSIGSASVVPSIVLAGVLC